ncbi:type IV secretion system protein [Rhodovulum sp. MB263]|uniref:type IV secretion system protein n=1 Tax=Rhodovulum sp. (strain MB263) TaxID=308754 RepID=UPI0018C88243|nr:type IV secretion system protein [Rhodovulum sp. MB263]
MLVLLFKISLIKAFALNWANFNFVSEHLIDGLDELAGSLIGSATGEEAIGSAYFAARFDLQMDRLAEYGNEAASHMSRVSKALMGVFFMALIALVGGLAGAVLVLAKMMITLLIGLAPVMILCSMFDVTKDYFHRWVSSLASFSLYPVVIAGVFSMVFGLVTLLVSDLGAINTADKAGEMVPFLGVV